MSRLSPSRKVIAKPEFFEMAGAQMRLEIEHFLEIVRADLDAGFANFVRRFGRRMPPLFGDSNPQRSVGPSQLARKAEAGEATSSDKNINVHFVSSPIDASFNRANALGSGKITSSRIIPRGVVASSRVN